MTQDEKPQSSENSENELPQAYRLPKLTPEVRKRMIRVAREQSELNRSMGSQPIRNRRSQ